MINAFSLPGGPVYIGEGMLDQMETEDELASILAHEVEHIDHYHCVERVQIEAKLKNANLELMGQLLQIPLEFWQAGYHKDEEFEADREGVRLAVESGYSPYGAVSIFTRLAKLCNEYVIHAQSPEARTLRAGDSEFDRLFPFAPAPLRAPRPSQPPNR